MTFQIRKRSRLPHWDVDQGAYFITTNLIDAVPQEVRKAYITEVERRKGHMTAASPKSRASSPTRVKVFIVRITRSIEPSKSRNSR
jgi:hypothetical protein